MSIRNYLATAAVNWARSFGRLLGTELVVETSQHSIETRMEQPDKTQRAWDPDLYKHGQLFYAGYANPIKPAVDVRNELEDPDTVDIVEGDADATQADTADADEDADDSQEEHVQMISSPRYRKYMRQDLISQLLTPKEQWRIIAYGVLGLAALQFTTIAVILYATGSF